MNKYNKESGAVFNILKTKLDFLLGLISYLKYLEPDKAELINAKKANGKRVIDGVSDSLTI